MFWTRLPSYVFKILKGAKPSDLPVEPTHFELFINRKTAKVPGIMLAPSLRAR